MSVDLVAAMASFEFGTFFLSWLLAMSSDFLDASFLVTVSLTLYAPCCGFRDNEKFFSLDRFLLFVGCSLALVMRTVLLFSDVDPLQWDGYCHVGASLMLFVFFVEAIMKWRRAVYGRSQLATNLGRRMPEDRDSGARRARATNTASNMVEDGRRPLALDNGANLVINTTTSSDGTTPLPAGSFEGGVKDYSCKYVTEKLSHFFVPGIAILLVAAGDGQTTACSKLAHDRLDLAMGESVGLIISTMFAVLLGGFLKWYIHDAHLLLYISLVFFGECVVSIQGSIVDMLMKDLPEAVGL